MSVKVFGLEEVTQVLEEIAPKHANNLSRAVIHGLASETAKEAKSRVPKRTGTLKKAIKAKRRRSKPGRPVSDVIITKGKTAKNDAFYWHFVEYGTGGKSPQEAQPFLHPALEVIETKRPAILEEQFKKKLVSAVNRELRKQSK